MPVCVLQVQCPTTKIARVGHGVVGVQDTTVNFATGIDDRDTSVVKHRTCKRLAEIDDAV